MTDGPPLRPAATVAAHCIPEKGLMGMVCERCGAAPAGAVKSRRHLGLIVYGRTTTTSSLLCREHARSLVLSDLGKTMVLGWWGILSFFINIGVVIGQLLALCKTGEIEAGPVPATPAAVTGAGDSSAP